MKIIWSHLLRSCNSLSGPFDVERADSESKDNRAKPSWKIFKTCEEASFHGESEPGKAFTNLLPRGKNETVAQMSSRGGCLRLVFWKLLKKCYKTLMRWRVSARTASRDLRESGKWVSGSKQGSASVYNSCRALILINISF